MYNALVNLTLVGKTRHQATLSEENRRAVCGRMRRGEEGGRDEGGEEEERGK